MRLKVSPPSSTTRQGRSSGEDGGGETFLPREEWAQPGSRRLRGGKPWGRKSRRRHCGKAIEALPSCGEITPSRGRAGRAPDSLARRRRGRHGSVQEARLQGRRNRNPGVQKRAPAIRD